MKIRPIIFIVLTSVAIIFSFEQEDEYRFFHRSERKCIRAGADSIPTSVHHTPDQENAGATRNG